MKNRQESIYLIVIISTGILFLGIIMYSFKSSAIYEGLLAGSIGNQLITPTPNGISGSVSGSAFTNQKIPRDESITQVEGTIVEYPKHAGYFIRHSNDSSIRLNFDSPPTEESLKSNQSKQKYRLESTFKNKCEDSKSSLEASKSSREKDAKRYNRAQESVVSDSGIGNGTANEINP